jgi:RNA polymerase sigma-70 factor, ECF subfamily
MTETEFSLEAFRAGDRNQFAVLVDTYSPHIYRLALKMLGNEQDAEDVLQTTFIKVFQHLGEFEGRSSLSTWLYRVAANEALMLIRRKRPSISLDEYPQDDDGEFTTPFELADWSSLPESDLLNDEVKLHLDQSIQNLPPKLRVVFLMRDVQELSIKETAEALELTETTVKTRLLRARLFLREELSAYFGKRLQQEKSKNARS